MGDASNPSLIWEIGERLRFEGRKHWRRWALKGRSRSDGKGFFDDYPRFFDTSSTAAKPDRLNLRYRALIESNAAAVIGRRILDLASHDGRWALAALKAGAKHVVGIEARPHLIRAAQDSLGEYGLSGNQFEFIQGDVLKELDRLEVGRFDTVFCFGFLYHIIDHMPLFRKIARLKPANLIIDTAVSVRPSNLIEIRAEEIEDEGSGAFGEPGDSMKAVTGRPTKSALELMLQAAGFQPLGYYDWRRSGVRRWDDVGDYYIGTRVSLNSESRPVKQL
jgi:hypothetical protein